VTAEADAGIAPPITEAVSAPPNTSDPASTARAALAKRVPTGTTSFWGAGFLLRPAHHLASTLRSAAATVVSCETS